MYDSDWPLNSKELKQVTDSMYKTYKDQVFKIVTRLANNYLIKFNKFDDKFNLYEITDNTLSKLGIGLNAYVYTGEFRDYWNQHSDIKMP